MGRNLGHTWLHNSVARIYRVARCVPRCAQKAGQPTMFELERVRKRPGNQPTSRSPHSLTHRTPHPLILLYSHLLRRPIILVTNMLVTNYLLQLNVVANAPGNPRDAYRTPRVSPGHGDPPPYADTSLPEPGCSKCNFVTFISYKLRFACAEGRRQPTDLGTPMVRQNGGNQPMVRVECGSHLATV